ILILSASICVSQEHGERPGHGEQPRPPVVPKTTNTITDMGGWVKYASSDGHYSVLLPSLPKLSTQESKTADGVPFLQYMASSMTDKVVCLIGYFDYAQGTTFSFDRARDGFVGAVNGRLLAETAVSLEGYPGRAFIVQGVANDGTPYKMRVRIYEVKNRVYVVQFIMSTTQENDPAVNVEARRYFDSFSVSSPE